MVQEDFPFRLGRVGNADKGPERVKVEGLIAGCIVRPVEMVVCSFRIVSDKVAYA